MYKHCFAYFSIVPGIVQNFVVSTNSSANITISWEPPEMLNGNVSGYRINLTSLSSRHQYFMEWNVSSQQLSIYVTGLGKETEDGANIILMITN